MAVGEKGLLNIFLEEEDKNKKDRRRYEAGVKRREHQRALYRDDVKHRHELKREKLADRRRGGQGGPGGPGGSYELIKDMFGNPTHTFDPSTGQLTPLNEQGAGPAGLDPQGAGPQNLDVLSQAIEDAGLNLKKKEDQDRVWSLVNEHFAALPKDKRDAARTMFTQSLANRDDNLAKALFDAEDRFQKQLGESTLGAGKTASESFAEGSGYTPPKKGVFDWMTPRSKKALGLFAATNPVAAPNIALAGGLDALISGGDPLNNIRSMMDNSEKDKSGSYMNNTSPGIYGEGYAGWPSVQNRVEKTVNIPSGMFSSEDGNIRNNRNIFNRGSMDFLPGRNWNQNRNRRRTQRNVRRAGSYFGDFANRRLNQSKNPPSTIVAGVKG
jgi:hypothetical protein